MKFVEITVKPVAGIQPPEFVAFVRTIPDIRGQGLDVYRTKCRPTRNLANQAALRFIELNGFVEASTDASAERNFLGS